MLNYNDEKTKAVLKLMGELSKGEQSAKENGWTDISEVEKIFYCTPHNNN
ncbi:MAG: hypothetical protein PUG48_12035 [Clostridia bacterium]|nr:hypothetical protein [Clostridia bacterium]